VRHLWDPAVDDDVEVFGKGCRVRAVRLHPPGRVEDLRLDEIDPPEGGPGQVSVRVHAAAVTRGELEWPVDRLPAIPSYELSGVVARDGDGFSTGDDVFALTPFDRDGVAAEYASVPADVLARRPTSLDHAQAAALPMPGLTAWQALVVHGQLRSGERVAVTGAHGGVGHVAVQLARGRGGVLVDAGEPCDLLFDTVGGDELVTAAGAAGRVVTIAEEAPGADYFIVEPDGRQLAEVGRLIERGGLRVEIDSVFPLSEAGAAFRRSTEHGKHGKVVIQVVG
jgi:NADPH:quinone reductase-like Zn-dependent oxidoreductase